MKPEVPSHWRTWKQYDGTGDKGVEEGWSVEGGGSKTWEVLQD